ncbi:MAG TPA: GNAT family N-acetyltransferase [Aliidongia sp.]|nr:GNAT family N-acetyltransferase [Aliidongia sp.]
MTIRQATSADADTLFEIHQDAIAKGSGNHYTPEQMRIWFEGRSPAIYDKYIKANQVWAAEAADGRLLGFVGIVPGEVILLYVRETAAGRGIGTRLLKHGVEEAQAGFEGPVKVIALLNAESFYARSGFTKIRDTSFRRGDPPLDFPTVEMVLAPEAIMSARHDR